MYRPRLIITLGPASLNKEFLSTVHAYDIDLLRINMSHTRLENLESTIQFIQQLTDIPICIDSEGAQLRCQQVGVDSVYLSEGSSIKVHHDDVVSDYQNISFYPDDITHQFEVGDVINIDFDSASIKIEHKEQDYLLAKVITPGIIGSNKACDSTRKLNLPALTPKDCIAFEIGEEYNIHNYALSFASDADSVHKLRGKFKKDIRLISKIESISGLNNLDEILTASDEILIDRGDLSRQVTIEAIPFLQKIIIERARFFRKPVVVATNLLETIIHNKYPTRAEANDVISTLMMGASGLVLAAETAIGKYPLNAVHTAETLINHYDRWKMGVTIPDILNFLGE